MYSQRCLALTWLLPRGTAADSAPSVYTVQPCTVSRDFMQTKPHTEGACMFSCNLPPAHFGRVTGIGRMTGIFLRVTAVLQHTGASKHVRHGYIKIIIVMPSDRPAMCFPLRDSAVFLRRRSCLLSVRVGCKLCSLCVYVLVCAGACPCVRVRAWNHIRLSGQGSCWFLTPSQPCW